MADLRDLVYLGAVPSAAPWDDPLEGHARVVLVLAVLSPQVLSGPVVHHSLDHEVAAKVGDHNSDRRDLVYLAAVLAVAQNADHLVVGYVLVVLAAPAVLSGPVDHHSRDREVAAQDGDHNSDRRDLACLAAVLAVAQNADHLVADLVPVHLDQTFPAVTGVGHQVEPVVVAAYQCNEKSSPVGEVAAPHVEERKVSVLLPAAVVVVQGNTGSRAEGSSTTSCTGHRAAGCSTGYRMPEAENIHTAVATHCLD